MTSSGVLQHDPGDLKLAHLQQKMTLIIGLGQHGDAVDHDGSQSVAEDPARHPVGNQTDGGLKGKHFHRALGVHAEALQKGPQAG